MFSSIGMNGSHIHVHTHTHTYTHTRTQSCSRSAEQLREVYNLLALEDTLNVYSQFSDISLNFNSAESNYNISEFLCGDAERGLSGFLRGTVDRLSEGDSYRRGENYSWIGILYKILSCHLKCEELILSSYMYMYM